MTFLNALQERRAELLGRKQALDTEIAALQGELAGLACEARIAAAQLDEVESAVALYGEFAGAEPAPPPDRAARRHIRQEVLDWLTQHGSAEGETVEAIAAALSVRPRSVEAALDHWMGRDKLVCRPGATEGTARYAAALSYASRAAAPEASAKEHFAADAAA
jgi:hypothetical protein